METGIGRRMFVGSVVAGLPLLASTARVAAQAGAGSLHQHPDATVVSDQVLEHLVRQLAGIHNAMRRQPSGESMRSFGSQLRTLAVYGRQAGLDANPPWSNGMGGIACFTSKWIGSASSPT